MSRSDYPKQFLAPQGGATLLQQTLRRVAAADWPALLVCSETHRFLAAEQIRTSGVADATILLEPLARNTAPAIAAAAWHVLQEDAEGVMVVMPADHLIEAGEAFGACIGLAVQRASQGDIVTLGVAPDYAETGFGYIEAGSAADNVGVRSVVRFIEKPDAAMATALVESGRCYWNSGIVVCRARTFLDTLKALEPAMHELTRQSVEAAVVDLDFLRLEAKSFAACRCVSVDYAVMERADNVLMLPAAFPWSDIGSWNSMRAAATRDAADNAIVGDVVQVDSQHCYLRAESRLLAVCGLDGIGVIETPDAVLVVNLQSARSIRQLVARLTAAGRRELIEHQTVHRPWGSYVALHQAQRFQVKLITVHPGAAISLQKHLHRAEHWVVVSGTATVTRGSEEIQLFENESTCIPPGEIHRLHNPGRIPLELIEVQSGSYLGEDDIVRFSDEYGRE